MEGVYNLVTDEQIKNAFGNSNFGSVDKREIIRNTLLKCACGYHTGHTAKQILQELGLVYSDKWELTKHGQRYLWESYSNGISI